MAAYQHYHKSEGSSIFFWLGGCNARQHSVSVSCVCLPPLLGFASYQQYDPVVKSASLKVLSRSPKSAPLSDQPYVLSLEECVDDHAQQKWHVYTCESHQQPAKSVSENAMLKSHKWHIYTCESHQQSVKSVSENAMLKSHISAIGSG